MKRILTTAAVLLLGAGTASAQDCTADGDAFDLDGEAVGALYACIEQAMLDLSLIHISEPTRRH